MVGLTFFTVFHTPRLDNVRILSKSLLLLLQMGKAHSNVKAETNPDSFFGGGGPLPNISAYETFANFSSFLFGVTYIILWNLFLQNI